MASARACANVRRDDRGEASARPGAAWVALPSSQRALLAGRSHSRRVWRHSPTPTRLGDIAPWLKLRVWGKHILVGRDRSRDTCESRSHVYAMLCYEAPHPTLSEPPLRSVGRAGDRSGPTLLSVRPWRAGRTPSSLCRGPGEPPHRSLSLISAVLVNRFLLHTRYF